MHAVVDACRHGRACCLSSWHSSTGSIPGGLVSHPDGQHIIYPLGCTVIVEDAQNLTQSFLSGHSDNVSCLACSPSGQFLASGQVSSCTTSLHSLWHWLSLPS